MAGMQLNSRRTALRALLCAMTLGALLAPESPAASPAATNLPGGCGARPSWIESATLPQEGQNPVTSCFASDSSQAEVSLSMANNRSYAQLITVSGASLDLTESSFASSLEAAFSRFFANSSSPNGLSAFLLAPGKRATLQIDRPAPGQAQQVQIDPASDNAFAVGALAWTLLSTAAEHLSLPATTQSCIAAAVYGALQSPPQPERALRRIHVCVNASGLSGGAEKLLRTLAGGVLRGSSFQEVIQRQGSEPHPARIAFTIAQSNPYLVDPAIHLGPAGFGALPAGKRTVEHLSASGGTPPYRFYIVPEPGGEEVPSWLKLATDGTLTVEPPLGATAVNLPVEVVDANGEHSLVAY